MSEKEPYKVTMLVEDWEYNEERGGWDYKLRDENNKIHLVKETDTKKADIKKADTKDADTKDADTKEADTKQTDAQQADSK